MATKAGLFNNALLELGYSVLADTGEDVEAGRVLNAIYDGVVKQCIAAGPWQHAMEVTQPNSLGASPSNLGYDHVYEKPSDWVATETVAVIGTKFKTPLLAFYDDRTYWAADTGSIDIRYVSNDTGAGFELAKWGALFTRYVEMELAFQACPKLTQGLELRERIGKERDLAYGVALSKESFVSPWPTQAAATTSRVDIIHRALIEIGDLGKINVRTDDFRRAADRVYDRSVAECLLAGFWNFAMKTALVTGTADTSLGYTHSYTKPSTWLRTQALAFDSQFTDPLLAYYDDGSQWGADTGEFHVRYLSSDTGAGGELLKWPASFVRYVELEVAFQICDNVLGHQPSTKHFRVRHGEEDEQGERKGNDPEPKSLKEALFQLKHEAKQRALSTELFIEPWPTLPDGTSRASVIHSALIEIGSMGKISAPADDPRRALGRLYDKVVTECLSAGFWNFAMETIAAEADTGPIPGYSHVYNKPSDWVRTQALAKDADFTDPLLAYYDDRRWWASDTGAFYARYVSNDTGLGREEAKWPPLFRRYVELELAFQAADVLREAPSDGKEAKAEMTLKERLFKEKETTKAEALRLESFVEPWPTYTAGISKLAIIHSALLELGDIGKVSQATDDARRTLNRLYEMTVDHCLSRASWNFATETIEANADTGVTPNFGYQWVFAKPADWVRTVGVSQDENLINPLLTYYDDINFWSADMTPIYIRYVSDDTGMGYELTRWTEAFRRYVELELATRACMEITKNPALRTDIERRRDEARKMAMNMDAMNEPQPKFAPTGSWTNARGGQSGNPRNSRSRLIG